MDDLDSSNFDADTKGFSLIDVSVSDDDFLFSSSSTSEANAVDNQGESFVEEAHADKPSDLLAGQRPRKLGKCNMRKSLAWDSAFFTSAGVLDAEELSSIMEGAETGLKSDHQLPGIQEELSKSTDSIATFESDSLTLESIEADLFSDIRASIQRSSKTSNPGNKIGDGESGNGLYGGPAAKKTGQPSPGNTMKPKLSSRNLVPAVQGPARMLKPTTSITKQVAKPVARGRELNSTLLRPPAPTIKANLEGTAASKRMSVSASRAKSETHHAGNIKGAGKETLISKGPRQVDSRNTLHKSMAPSKLSSASSKTAIRSSQTSYDSSSGSSTAGTTTTKYRPQNNLGSASITSSSENIRKSLSDAVRRKIDKNTNLAPGSKIRTPSRLPMKSKSRPGESQLSAYVNSTTELSPSISPASSVSEWSLESSSSTATVNQKNSGLKHGSTPEVGADSNLSHDTSLDRHDHQVASMVNQSAKQPSRGPAVSLAGPDSAKPSGLRLPSPKIGFFDGTKAATKTPSGTARTRSAIPSNLPRSASGNHSPGPVNKAKSGSDAVKMSTLAAKTSKLDPRKSQSSPKLTKQLHDQSVGLPSGNVSDAISEVSNYSTLQSNSIVAHAADEGKHVVDSCSEPKNHSTCSQKDSDSEIVNGSDPSFGLPKSTSTSSALERNTSVPEEAGSEKLECSSPEIRCDKIDPYKSQASPKLTKQLYDSPVVLPSSDDSDTLPNCALERNSEVSEDTKVSELVICSSPEIRGDTKVDEVKDGVEHPDDHGSACKDGSVVLKKEACEERINTAATGSDAKKHSNAMQKDPTFIIVNNGSDTSIDLLKSATTNSALERNTQVSEEADGGTHFAEVSFIAKDHSEVVLTTSNFNDGPETNSEAIRHFSSEIVRDTKVAEVKDREEHPNDFSPAFNDDFILPEEAREERNITVAKATDGGQHVAYSGSDVTNNSTGLQKDQTFIDGSDTSILLPEPTSTDSALGRTSEVSEEAISGKHFDEVSLTAKDHAEVLVTSIVPKFDDEVESNSEQFICSSPKIQRNRKGAEVVDGDDHPDAKNHSNGLQKDPSLVKVDDGSGTSIELPQSASTNSVLERNTQVSEVANGGIHFSEDSLIAKDHSELSEVVPKTQSIPNFDVNPETNSELIEYLSTKIRRGGEVAETTDSGEQSEVIEQTELQPTIALKFDDISEANIELPGCFSPKIRGDEKAANTTNSGEHSEATGLQSTIGEIIDGAIDDPNGTCGSSFRDAGVSQETRSPAVENLVPDDVEASDSLTLSASEAFLERDVMPSPEKYSNENS